MNYSAELHLLVDTFHKYGLTVAIADLSRPPSQNLIAEKFILQKDSSLHTKPLRELIPPIHPATVYTAHTNQYCFTYFLLPDLQPEALMILGPYLDAALTLDEFLESAELQDMDIHLHRQLEKYFSSLPVFPKSSHLHLLLDAFFDRIWGIGGYTSETINPGVRADASELWAGHDLSEDTHALLSATIMEERYAHENGLIEAVRLGQTRRVDAFLSRITPSNFEMRVSDPVRNLKNYCIITNTLLRKAAEQGGVHPVYIDNISSAFAYKIEELSSTAAGPDLISEMAQVYCRLVRKHNTKKYSPPIQNAILLIEGDLAGNLALTRLAEELNVNSSYLSTLFKKETGSTVTDYITDRRISHAKHLLKTTRLQIQTIGQSCGFEDMHYFSKVFKRHTGVTPKQYRETNIGK